MTGDATVSLIVAYHEQALDLDVYHDPDAGDAAEQAATCSKNSLGWLLCGEEFSKVLGGIDPRVVDLGNRLF